MRPGGKVCLQVMTGDMKHNAARGPGEYLPEPTEEIRRVEAGLRHPRP